MKSPDLKYRGRKMTSLYALIFGIVWIVLVYKFYKICRPENCRSRQ
jgi:hypothetical protein